MCFTKISDEVTFKINRDVDGIVEEQAMEAWLGQDYT